VVDTLAPTPATGTRIRYAARPETARFTTARLVSLDADRMVFERFVPSTTGRRSEWVPGTLPTDSLVRLQVHIGKRDNAGRGALIGAGVGGALGLLCAAAGDHDALGAPSEGQCVVSGFFSGALVGLLIGALNRSDVWAPAALPVRPPEPENRQQLPGQPPVAGVHDPEPRP
jgi:hypothetical protein